MSIKICIFSALYPPHVGGVERYTEQMALKLKELGFQIIVVTSQAASATIKEATDGINVYRVPVFHILGGRLPVPVPGRSLVSQIRKISGFQADVFITNTRFYPHSLLAGWLARKQRKPLLLIEHGAAHPPMPGKVRSIISHALEHGMTAILAKLVTGFYGVSQACNEWLGHFGIQAKGIFHNGIDTSYQIQHPYDIREKLHLPQDAVLISFVGRLIEEKGIRTLVEAYRDLEDKYPNIHLLVAGNGPLSESLPVSGRMSLLGRLEYDEVMNLLDQTDIFVLPSQAPEGLPTSVLEAGSRRCCVIAGTLGGTKEIITGDQYGIGLDAVTREQLRSALEQVIVDKELRVRLADRLYARVVSEFDWSILAARMSDEIAGYAKGDL